MAHFLLKDIPTLEHLEKLAQDVPEADPLRMNAYLTLLKVSDHFLSSLDSYFARFGMSQGRFIMLILLHRARAEGKAALSMKTLADHAGVTKPTVTGLIAGLERDGLVAREADPDDGRSQLVSLTPAGRNLLQEILPQHFRTIREFLGEFSESEVRSLLRLLAKVDSRMGHFSASKA